jgi:hypothetical protein
MCDICKYMADEDPVKLNPATVLGLIAAKMKSAKKGDLDHLTALVDKVIGFKEPENRETPAGLMGKS